MKTTTLTYKGTSFTATPSGEGWRVKIDTIENITLTINTKAYVVMVDRVKKFIDTMER